MNRTDRAILALLACALAAVLAPTALPGCRAALPGQPEAAPAYRAAGFRGGQGRFRIRCGEYCYAGVPAVCVLTEDGAELYLRSGEALAERLAAGRQGGAACPVVCGGEWTGRGRGEGRSFLPGDIPVRAVYCRPSPPDEHGGSAAPERLVWRVEPTGATSADAG